MTNDLWRELISDDNPENRELMRLRDGLADFPMESGLDEEPPTR
jgi:hypothetical protein